MESAISTLMVVVPAIFARIIGLVGFAPGWGEAAMSVRLRLLLSVALTITVLGGLSATGDPALHGLSFSEPAVSGTTLSDSSARSSETLFATAEPMAFSLSWALNVAANFLVGMFQAMVLRLLLTSLEYAGSIISQVSGLAMAETFDPVRGNVPLLSGFLCQAGIVLFFAVAGDHLLVSGLLDSFGAGDMVSNLSNASGTMLIPLLHMISGAMWLGLLMAMPVVLSMLVVHLSAGLLARLVPAWGFWNVGMPIAVLTGLLLLILSLDRFAALLRSMMP